MIDIEQLINKERREYRRGIFEFENLEIIEGELYALNSLTESIISINYDTGNARLVARISGNKLVFPRFRILTENNGNLYLIPCLENYIVKYSLKHEKYSKIELPLKCNFGKDKRGFVSCLKTDKYLVLYGFQPLVLFLSLENDSVVVCDSWRKMYDKTETDVWFWKDAFVMGEYVYLLPYEYSSTWLKISLQDFSANIIKVGHEEICGALQYIGVDESTNIVYLLHSQSGLDGNIDNLISWKEDNDEIETWSLHAKIPFCKIRGSFEGRFVLNNKIWLLPGSSSKGYMINIDGFSINELQVPHTDKLNAGFLSIYNYSAFCTNNNCIYSIFPWEEKIICIDTEQGTVAEKKIVFDSESENIFRDIIDCKTTNDEKYLKKGLRSYISFLTTSLE